MSDYPHHEASTVVAHLHSRGISDLPSSSTVKEVSDGNLNRVFLVQDPARGTGVAVKQALPWIRVQQDWPLGPERAALEVAAYRHLAEHNPDLVPAVHDYDPATYTIVMDDLSALRVLRGETVAGRRHPEVAAQVGRFCGRLAAGTGPLGLDLAARSRLAVTVQNPELCQMTLDVVLTEPYLEHEHNHHDPALDDLVAGLRADPSLARAMADVRHIFITHSESLVHGDLHSGSIMVAPDGDPAAVRIFDPEFAFLGPSGFDLGVYWGNCLTAGIVGDIAVSWDAFETAYRSKVDPPAGHLSAIWTDALAFAGTEAMRRVIGYSHARELAGRPEAAAWVARSARTMIVERASLPDFAALTAALGEPPW
ncbi:phosphotransferase [Actinoplanes sp. NPDC051851]|uniref:phosphotransferase n=1 Tax=Actinoplanes sp. NPDC051851 TaxID=3154753 RepID=UPI00342A2AD5